MKLLKLISGVIALLALIPQNYITKTMFKSPFALCNCYCNLTINALLIDTRFIK